MPESGLRNEEEKCSKHKIIVHLQFSVVSMIKCWLKYPVRDLILVENDPFLTGRPVRDGMFNRHVIISCP